jgi:UDP-N-acetylmuramate--alanine ligase
MEIIVSPEEPVKLQKGARLFFVGIGGISMRGLAEIAQAAGFTVAGSDRFPSRRTDDLPRLGIQFYPGHQPDWIDDFQPDWVIHSSAVHFDNPELIRAAELGIPVIPRADFLGWLNRNFAKVINIAGTHGKTTTTAMCALILMASGTDPTVHLGAELEQFHGTVHLGEPGRLMVSEADEYMRSFLRFYSTTAAILNIDYDHVDCYANIDEVIDSFCEFADHLPESGCLVVPSFDANVTIMLERLSARRRLAGRAMPRLIRFGGQAGLAAADLDFHYRGLTYEAGRPCFEVWHRDIPYCRVRLQIPGLHNVWNALAAIACASENGGTAADAESVLNSYTGAEGRFTVAGEYRGTQVVADYAHHPTAVRVTIDAARNLGRPHTWIVFQPLTYSRTRVLIDDFARALQDSELVILSEIFSDRETDPGDISSRHLALKINELGGHAIFARSFDQIKDELDQVVQPGDLILVLGPENIRGFADLLTRRGKPPHGI